MFNRPGGLDQFNEKRFLGSLKELAELLREHGNEEWAAWFRGDLEAYQTAQGASRQIARQMASVEHVLMAFGGMSDFTQQTITDESGEMLAEPNERLQTLSTHLWAAARGLQAFLASELNEQ